MNPIQLLNSKSGRFEFSEEGPLVRVEAPDASKQKWKAQTTGPETLYFNSQLFGRNITELLEQGESFVFQPCVRIAYEEGHPTSVYAKTMRWNMVLAQDFKCERVLEGCVWEGDELDEEGIRRFATHRLTEIPMWKLILMDENTFRTNGKPRNPDKALFVKNIVTQGVYMGDRISRPCNNCGEKEVYCGHADFSLADHDYNFWHVCLNCSDTLFTNFSVCSGDEEKDDEICPFGH